MIKNSCNILHFYIFYIFTFFIFDKPMVIKTAEAAPKIILS
jgi:hypothetical protein